MYKKVVVLGCTFFLSGLLAACKPTAPSWIIDFDQEGPDRQVVLFEDPDQGSFYRILSQSDSEPARLEQYSHGGELLSGRQLTDLCDQGYQALSNGRSGVYLLAGTLACSRYIDLVSVNDHRLDLDLPSGREIRLVSSLVNAAGDLVFSGRRVVPQGGEEYLYEAVLGSVSIDGKARIIDDYNEAVGLSLQAWGDSGDLLLRGVYEWASEDVDGASFIARLNSDLVQLSYQDYPFEIFVGKVFADMFYGGIQTSEDDHHGLYSQSMELIQAAPFSRYAVLDYFWEKDGVYVVDTVNGLFREEVLRVCRYDLAFNQSWCRNLKSGALLEAIEGKVSDAGALALSYWRLYFPLSGIGVDPDAGVGYEGNEKRLEVSHVVLTRSGKQALSAAEQAYGYKSTTTQCLVWRDCSEETLMDFKPGMTSIDDVLYLSGGRLVSAGVFADGPLELQRGDEKQRLTYFEP
ncbi:MAG: hypothetical protein R3208_22690 [Ketobacteraceae bacterium]|nr:hypothetical protein [Ketobacteraceae bacterium]